VTGFYGALQALGIDFQGILHGLGKGFQVSLYVLGIGFKGIAQRILRGVNNKLKYSVLVNWRPAYFSF
jgi:hypothetical protein